MTFITHDDEYYRQRKPQPELGAVDSFKRFLWEPKRRAFLDRTANEWAGVGIFYLCFYSVLFSIFFIQLYLTYKHVLNNKHKLFSHPEFVQTRAWLEPEHNLMFRKSSLNGPGITMKPNIIPNSNPPLILLDKSRAMGKSVTYVDAVRETLREYEISKSKYDMNCSDMLIRNEPNQKPCFFNIKTLGVCSEAPYGYTEKAHPCIYIKFNKKFHWLPIFYSQASFLPDNMPLWLQKIIQRSDKFHVWLSCEGKTDKDRERIGAVEYLPEPGFPVQYFPFLNQPDYLAPVVALHFKNLTVNHLVTIECKTWARNIDNENRHHLTFRVLIKVNRKGNENKFNLSINMYSFSSLL